MDDYVLKIIKEDKIDCNKQGFCFKSHGRAATIYYVEDNSVVPIYAQMPGVDYFDILIFGETRHIAKRYYMNEQKVEIIEPEDRFRIQELLIKWLDEKGLRHDIKPKT